MKFCGPQGSGKTLSSRPARGAWIEMMRFPQSIPLSHGRAPQGARGLKFQKLIELRAKQKVAPRKGRVD